MKDRSLFWFRVPDVESGLMSLKPAQLKCYLVVLRAIQRDRNRGLISVRQVARRARLSVNSAQAALTHLVDNGWLNRESKPRATSVYTLPHAWVERSIAGGQQRSAVIEQHLESSEGGSPRLITAVGVSSTGEVE
jgi:hypothetical protein